MKTITPVSTGYGSLDSVINNLLLGDNVVWQVDNISDYRIFVDAFVEKALEDSRRVIYIRFARHDILVKNSSVEIHILDAYSGFESFSKQVYDIITAAGPGAFYVFDCLSDLLSAWATDLMIGNFFVNTCPYLYELDTIAYFALLRNSHDFKTIARIRDTTQVLIDVYSSEDQIYIHPLKVLNRYSNTMFFPHKKIEHNFMPVSSSSDVVTFMDRIKRWSEENTRRNLDFWDRLFLDVEEMVKGGPDVHEREQMLDNLSRIIIGRDERILSLVKQHFTLEDFIQIKSRLLGSGYIGGKAVGMLLSRKILSNSSSEKWNDLLESHDSFYIGSDVFYTYIVQNGLWRMFMEQKTPDNFFTAANKLRDKMLEGNFPDEIKEQFRQIIEYFGQSPIIVRSSSLLEDAFGNAFAGKYESYFCVNQGSPQERYNKFLEAVRRIYASTMNEDALAYRLQRGLAEKDEQMALLVQRVSGSHRNRFFFPDVAGVGLSYNTYVWKKDMDPEAGMLRIVFGLGTRAVERVEGDYPRIVALDEPLAQPLGGMEDIRRFSQHQVDVLDIEKNSIITCPFEDLVSEDMHPELDMVAVQDHETARRMREMNITGKEPWIITFDNLLRTTTFADDMKEMMQKIEETYDYPVDIEFTLNFSDSGKYRVNLLQCRPHQTKGETKNIAIPQDINMESVLFRTYGNFLGGSISEPVRRIIYIDPEGYSSLYETEKYEIARTVGRLNRLIQDRNSTPTMLLGPGRWGTTTPSLGIPVRFSEINNISVLVEIAQMHENLMPELSFGTHFFLDLVETDIFYAAIFPEKEGVLLNRKLLMGFENILSLLLPDFDRFSDIIRVHDLKSGEINIMADILTQELVCFKDSV